MIRRRRREATTDVVAALQEQVRQAQALAAVPEQELLRDPRLNPAPEPWLTLWRLSGCAPVWRRNTAVRSAPSRSGSVRQWRRSVRPRLWMPLVLPRTRR